VSVPTVSSSPTAPMPSPVPLIREASI
jgi:hypothetical protein